MHEVDAIGFIGLGNLGLPVAMNLLHSGRSLRVYNRTASKAEPVVTRGAVLAAHPTDVLVAGGVVVTLVWDDAAVESVVESEGFLERLGRGGLHVSMSTIHPDTARHLAALHMRAGSSYVAAPIFGRPEAAEAKQLLVPLSGGVAAKERARPLLDAMGAKGVFDFGEDVGAATLVKLLGNFLIGSAVRSMAEALSIARDAGVDPKGVVDMLTSTLLAAPIFQSYGKRLAAGEPPFRGGIPEKDLGLLSRLGDERGVPTPIVHLMCDLVRGPRAQPIGPSGHPTQSADHEAHDRSGMRAVTITEQGGPEVLAVRDFPVRAAGRGEVRISVKAAAVNPTDILLRTNAAYSKGTPGIPGMDAAGVIESVGEGVDRLRVGDEVMAAVSPRRPEGGAQIELQVVPAASVVPIPNGATLAQASTLPMNGLTALLALDLLKLKAGEALAVSGGAGHLGSLAIVLAKQRGLRVIADAKASEVELVRSYGADVVVARGERFCEEVRAATNGGADALFDTAVLGREAFPAVRDGGAYVPVRGWDKTPAERGIRILPVMVSEALERTEWLNELRDVASQGGIKLRVAGEYPPERAADAQRAMEAGGLRGRAVIVF